MKPKFTALLLIATALPFSKALAYTASVHKAPVSTYMYVMLSIGAAYLLFLLIRMYRQKQQDEINSSSNKN
jgi:threonine/homoserine/homoserine lactone efflux protein